MTLHVNGEQIDDALIYKEADLLRPSYDHTFKDMEPRLREAQLIEWSRENVIERMLVRQYAKTYGPIISQEEMERTLEEMGQRAGGKEKLAHEFGAADESKLKDAIELQMRIDRLMEDICKDVPVPSSEQIQKYYKENKEQFKSPEFIRVAHIVKHINWRTDTATALATMKKVQDELKTGSVFENLVVKYSDCPENSGDLGYICRGQMVEEFDDVVFNMGTGQISDIFRTRFGFHIARVYDRKPPAYRGIDEAKDYITNELKKHLQTDAINAFIDTLKQKAEIKII
jgi:parvulin-like peptidyl-prolyl isomerase